MSPGNRKLSTVKELMPLVELPQHTSNYKKALILWSEILCIDKKHAHMRTPNRTSLKTQTSLVYLETRQGGGEAVERNQEGRLGRQKTENWRAKDGNRIRKQGERDKHERKRMLNQERGRERESTGEKSGTRHKWQAAVKREERNINKRGEKNSYGYKLLWKRCGHVTLQRGFKHQGIPL